MPWWGWSWSWNKTVMIYGFKFFLNLKGTAPCRPWTSSFEKTPLLSTEPMFPWRENLQIFPRGTTGNLLGSGIIARDPSVKVKRGQKDGSRRSNPSVDHRGKNQGKGDRMESFQERWVEKTLSKRFKKNKRKKVLDGYVFWSKIEKTSGNWKVEWCFWDWFFVLTKSSLIS